MKPKTLLQKKVFAIHQKLKPISEKQKEWAFSNCFDNYIVRTGKKLYCLQCGFSWKDPCTSNLSSSILGCDCPSCQSKLVQMDSKQKRSVHSYFSILTTRENFQVVRLFLLQKKMRKFNKPEYFCEEVIQFWINPSGDSCFLAKKTLPFSHFYDQWVKDSSLELRQKSYKASLLENIIPEKIYPARKVLPIIKRNGFNGLFYDYAPQKFFTLLLKNNNFEYLLKSKQFSLLNSFSQTSKLSTYRSSIKICTRHGYIVPDASIWFDYLDLLQFFGKDINNPKFICPKDLHASHDRLMNKKRRLDRKERLFELRDKLPILEKNYRREKRKFFKLRFKKDNITIKPLQSVKEFLFESDELRHCAFSNEYFSKKNSLVMSARINNRPVETIEISLKDYSIMQSRGKGNKATDFHDDIINIVNDNIPLIAKISSNRT